MQNIAISYFFTMTIYSNSTRIICWYSICLFCWYNIPSNYNFITLSHWSISNTFYILIISTYTCVRIVTIIFFALMIFLKFILTCLIISFLIWITCCTIESHEIFSAIALASSLFVITLNTLKFISFASYETYISGDKTLQYPTHLFKLIING